MRPVWFAATVAVGLLLACAPLLADEPLFAEDAFAESPRPAPQSSDPAASQPDPAAGLPATQPAAARAWFLTMPVSHDLFRHIDGGDLAKLDDLPRRRQASPASE